MKTKIVYAVVSDEKDVYLEEHHRPVYSKGIIMMKNMTYYTRKKLWLLTVLLTLCTPTVLAACSDSDNTIRQDSGKVAEIVERGILLIGTTGDYRPLSFCEEDGTYWGFGIEIAKEIANALGVETKFVKTTWPTLTADVLAEPRFRPCHRRYYDHRCPEGADAHERGLSCQREDDSLPFHRSRPIHITGRH